MHTVVAEECNNEVIAESQQIHCVPEEVGHPIVTRNERHEEELQHV